jgi:hypothetical protein
MMPRGQRYQFALINEALDYSHVRAIELRGRVREIILVCGERHVVEVPTYELLKADLLERYLDYWPDPHAGRRWLKQDHAPAFAVRARPWAPPAPPASPPARMPWPVQLRAFR